MPHGGVGGRILSGFGRGVNGSRWSADGRAGSMDKGAFGILNERALGGEEQ